MFQIMPALCPHGQGEAGWSTKCGQAWTGERGCPTNSQICADILYGWPLYLLLKHIYKYNIQITFLVVKQSHARVTSKDISLLFIILFLCLFPFCLVFVLFYEAFLFLHCLIDLVYSYISKFPNIYSFEYIYIYIYWVKYIKPEHSKPGKMYVNIKTHKINNPARVITRRLRYSSWIFINFCRKRIK